jgi:hypothetical protein
MVRNYDSCDQFCVVLIMKYESVVDYYEECREGNL